MSTPAFPTSTADWGAYDPVDATTSGTKHSWKFWAAIGAGVIIAAAALIIGLIGGGVISGVSFSKSSPNPSGGQTASPNVGAGSPGATSVAQSNAGGGLNQNPSTAGCNAISVALTASAVDTFESPTIPTGTGAQGFSYFPSTSSTQPWTWTQNGALGGIAALSGPYYPVGQTPPPSGSQYGFLQAAHTQTAIMSTSLSGITAGNNYQLSFYWDTRAITGTILDNTTQAVLNAQIDNNVIWTSNVYLADPTGVWNAVQVPTFSIPNCNSLLTFSFVPLPNNNFDQSAFIDNVLLTPVS